MFRSRRWLCVGLQAILVLLAVFVIWSDIATAGKNASPPVRYAMAKLEGNVSCMNNFGDVLGSSTAGPCVWISSGAASPTWTQHYVGGDIIAHLTSSGIWPASLVIGEQQKSDGTKTSFYIYPNAINDTLQICGTVKYSEFDSSQVCSYYLQAAFRYCILNDTLDLYYAPEYDASTETIYYHAIVSAINGLGQMAGCLTTSAAGKTLDVAPIVWNPDATSPSDQIKNLDLGPVASADRYAINDPGQVTYWSPRSADVLYSVRYTPGGDTYETILPLGMFGSSDSSRFSGMNNSGEVVGVMTTANGWYAFKYNGPGTISKLGMLGSNSLYPTKNSAASVNDVGQVVGLYYETVKGRNVARPFIYLPGNEMLRLWSLISNPPAGVTENGTVPLSINSPPGKAFGQILLNNNYILTPLP